MASAYLVHEDLIVAMYRVLNEQHDAVLLYAKDIGEQEACYLALALAGFTDAQIDQHADAARNRVRMIHHRLKLARAG